MVERADTAHEHAGREHACEGGRQQPVRGALAAAEAVDQPSRGFRHRFAAVRARCSESASVGQVATASRACASS